MAIDSQNQYLYVADTGSNRVVQINMQTGIANQIAGSNTCLPGTTGVPVGDGGAALNATLCNPTTVGLDNQNNLLIVDAGHNSIRRVTFNGASGGVLAFAPSNNDLSKLFKNADGTWTRIYRSGSSDYFNLNGFQTKSVDRVGNVVNFSYDGNSNLTQIQYPNGQSLQFEYSGGLLNIIRDPAGRVTNLNYNGNVLSQVIFPDGTKRTFTYDSNGMMTGQTDQRGNSTSYVYNQWNRLSQVNLPDGNVQSVNDWTSQSVANNSTSSNPQPVTGVGAGSGQISTVITNANGNSTQLTPDYMGYISTITDALGNTTKITRDLLGRPLTITRPDSTVMTMAYDATTGDAISKIDNATGISEAKTYDVFGNILTSTIGDVNGAYAAKTTTNIYDPNTGLLTQTQYPAGNTVSYQYNSQGLVSQKIIQNGSANIVMSYSYDNYGNIMQVVNNDGVATTFTYDLAGNQLSSTVTSTGSDTLTTVYAYDLLNRLSSVRSPKNEVTTYSYLATGELAMVTDPKNNQTTFQYDPMGRLAVKTDPLGMSYKFAYDGIGNRIQEIDPNGNVKKFSYDVLNRMTQAQYPDDLVQLQYDLRGNVNLITNNVSQIATTTDSQDRVIVQSLTGVGAMVNYPSIGFVYSYNDSGDRIQMKTSRGDVISYSYDLNDRLTSLSSVSGNFGFSYDGAGHLVGISRPGGNTAFTYLNSGLLSSIQHNEANGSDFEILNYDKRYVPVSKRTPAGQYGYGYDSNGQLLSASNPNSGVASEGFTYDSLGNRLTDSTGGIYSYDSLSQRLTDDGNYSYQYDNNGNVVRKISHNSTKESFSFTYNSRNQLIQTRVFVGVLTGVVRQINYVYDVLGRRMQKTVVDNSAPSDPKKSYTRNYIYDGQNIFYESDGGGSVLVQYTHSPNSLDDVLSANITVSGVEAGLASASGNYYYLKDHLGSVSSIADSSGNIIQRYDYRSFGKIITIRNSSGADVSSVALVNTSFTFTGREWDAESGLFYYRARYYDPSIGRFLQQDPHPGNIQRPSTIINKYQYVGNMPTILRDATGMNWDPIGDLVDGIGHLTGQIGSTWDSLVKSNLVRGIAVVIALVALAVVAPEAFAGGVAAVGMGALRQGYISWMNGNRSWSAFTDGVNSYFEYYDGPLVDFSVGAILGAYGGAMKDWIVSSDVGKNIFSIIMGTYIFKTADDWVSSLKNPTRDEKDFTWFLGFGATIVPIAVQK